jgi:hypothetical protein
VWGRRRGVDLLDSPEMAVFFAKLDRLDQAQLMSMRAAWQAIPKEEHEDAWHVVRAVGAGQGLSEEIGRVRDTAMAWATRGSNSVPYYRMNDDDMRVQIKREAGEAIVDAALAIALGSRLAISLGSRLDVTAHGTLIGPWLAATGAAG